MLTERQAGSAIVRFRTWRRAGMCTMRKSYVDALGKILMNSAAGIFGSAVEVMVSCVRFSGANDKKTRFIGSFAARMY